MIKVRTCPASSGSLPAFIPEAELYIIPLLCSGFRAVSFRFRKLLVPRACECVVLFMSAHRKRGIIWMRDSGTKRKKEVANHISCNQIEHPPFDKRRKKRPFFRSKNIASVNNAKVRAHNQRSQEGSAGLFPILPCNSKSPTLCSTTVSYRVSTSRLPARARPSAHTRRSGGGAVGATVAVRAWEIYSCVRSSRWLIHLLSSLQQQVIRAIESYQPQSDTELGFEKGDFFHVIGNENDPEWYEACNPATGARGFVPVPFFQALGKSERDSQDSQGLRDVKTDSGYADMDRPVSRPVGVGAPKPAKAGSPLYGVVLYDFHAERPDELDAKQGEPIIVIALSNDEWFVAKPIGRLGGPGLIPVDFIEIRDMVTGEAVEDTKAAIARAGVPRVEEWKKMAAEYKNSSIALGQFDFGDTSSKPSHMSMNGSQVNNLPVNLPTPGADTANRLSSPTPPTAPPPPAPTATPAALGPTSSKPPSSPPSTPTRTKTAAIGTSSTARWKTASPGRSAASTRTSTISKSHSWSSSKRKPATPANPASSPTCPARSPTSPTPSLQPVARVSIST